MCGVLHPEMRKLRMDTLRCECGNIMDRDHNAAANIYWYPEERENRIGNGPPRVEMGDQESAPVPVVETRISAYHGART
jgi:transposase